MVNEIVDEIVNAMANLIVFIEMVHELVNTWPMTCFVMAIAA